MTANFDPATDLERVLSAERAAPYLTAASGDPVRAFELYRWNGQLAGALLEDLGVVEVVVRNAVHARMSSTTSRNALHSWLADPELLGEKQRRAVQEGVGRLKRSGKPPTQEYVISTLYFSFWAQILGKDYEDLWRQRLAPAFPHAPGRRSLAGPANRLVQLRNRVAHHQTLYDQPIADRVTDAWTLLSAIGPSATALLAETSRLTEVLVARPSGL